MIAQILQCNSCFARTLAPRRAPTPAALARGPADCFQGLSLLPNGMTPQLACNMVACCVAVAPLDDRAEPAMAARALLRRRQFPLPTHSFLGALVAGNDGSDACSS